LVLVVCTGRIQTDITTTRNKKPETEQLSPRFHVLHQLSAESNQLTATPDSGHSRGHCQRLPKRIHIARNQFADIYSAPRRVTPVLSVPLSVRHRNRIGPDTRINQRRCCNRTVGSPNFQHIAVFDTQRLGSSRIYLYPASPHHRRHRIRQLLERWQNRRLSRAKCTRLISYQRHVVALSVLGI